MPEGLCFFDDGISKKKSKLQKNGWCIIGNEGKGEDMRPFLEIFRIILIFGLLGTIFSAISQYVYRMFDTTQYGWIGAAGIFLWMFVTYRNKWQFSGWYLGNGKEKLQKRTTGILKGISVLLLVVPIIIEYVG